MNTKGYISGPVFCQAPTLSVSNQDALFDGCYGVRQNTHSSGIGAFHGLLNCNSETSFGKPHQKELLTLSMEHKILLYYVNYKSTEVPGQKFLFSSLHSSLCCSSCTCVCQLAWHLTRHFDHCHSSHCLLCRPVLNLINSDPTKRGWERETGVNLKEDPISISPEKLIAGHRDEKVFQNDVIFIGDDDADLDGSPGPKEEPAPNHVIVIDDDPDDALISQIGPNKVIVIDDDSDDYFISENYPKHCEEPEEEMRDRTGAGPEINCNKKLQHLALYQEAKMQSCVNSSITEQSGLQQHDLFERTIEIDYETLQKKEVEVFRLEREASLMKKIIVGYREALKETNRAFAEYRTCCPMPNETRLRNETRCPLPNEPLYKDVPGTGGMELQKHIAVV